MSDKVLIDKKKKKDLRKPRAISLNESENIKAEELSDFCGMTVSAMFRMWLYEKYNQIFQSKNK